MSSSKARPLRALVSLVVVAAAVGLPTAAIALPAGSKVKPLARVTTGSANYILGTSALLTAVISPAGQETSYHFVYGLTTAYGFQTPSQSVGHGEAKVPVGQPIAGLQQGTLYHFRVVGTTTPPASTPAAIRALEGFDHTFTTKGSPLTFTVPRTLQDTFGSPVVLTGTLTGLSSSNHRVAIQASPYPFLEAFSNIGLPGITNGAGAFSFRVANLTAATQLRVTTLDPLPVYSPLTMVTVQPHVVLHVRSSGQPGLVRLYGTIAPAVNGARVRFQVQKAVRPGGNSEVTIAWVSQFATVAKKGPGNTSRFSLIATIKRGGRYRAFVSVPRGALTSGPSQSSFVLRAAPKK